MWDSFPGEAQGAQTGMPGIEQGEQSWWQPEGAGNWQDSPVAQADPLQCNSISNVTRRKARGRTHAR
ncbi:hypothetical protein EYF80_008812 [Liparis tanakae]|uniref:Uncharacterized protein n=1 Tax=Liparis tanakae TaxID=230148 RepID=A0A4Z2ISR6_9TELE|nr:hypothetical protein EYF80_008812 [Liparis tanakae]